MIDTTIWHCRKANEQKFQYSSSTLFWDECPGHRLRQMFLREAYWGLLSDAAPVREWRKQDAAETSRTIMQLRQCLSQSHRELWGQDSPAKVSTLMPWNTAFGLPINQSIIEFSYYQPAAKCLSSCWVTLVTIAESI